MQSVVVCEGARAMSSLKVSIQQMWSSSHVCWNDIGNEVLERTYLDANIPIHIFPPVAGNTFIYETPDCAGDVGSCAGGNAWRALIGGLCPGSVREGRPNL